MKLPNFRLHETQAVWSSFVGVVALGSLAALAICVFKGLQTDAWIVPYNPRGALGQYRNPLVQLMTALTLLLGAIAGVMGFTSLGQKRNHRQGLSWLGLAIGSLCVAMSPVLFFAWRTISEPIILTGNGG